MTPSPLVTIAVPSYNQARFLDKTLSSIFEQKLPVEVWVVDGGSTDHSLDIIRRWEPYLSGWRSYRDAGQAAAINEGIAQGSATYVCWLNSDDWFLPGALSTLLAAIERHPEAAVVYGRVWNSVEPSGRQYPVWVESFNEKRFARRCVISQPGTLIRRSAWEMVQGLDPSLYMAMDYDLWWRLFQNVGSLVFVDDILAVNRIHKETKTQLQRRLHYREAMHIVRKYYGTVPLKWWLAQPYAVWFKSSWVCG